MKIVTRKDPFQEQLVVDIQNAVKAGKTITSVEISIKHEGDNIDVTGIKVKTAEDTFYSPQMAAKVQESYAVQGFGFLEHDDVHQHTLDPAGAHSHAIFGGWGSMGEQVEPAEIFVPASFTARPGARFVGVVVGDEECPLKETV